MAKLPCSDKSDKKDALNCRCSHIPEVADEQEQYPSQERGLLPRVKQGTGQKTPDSHRGMVPMPLGLRAGCWGGLSPQILRTTFPYWPHSPPSPSGGDPSRPPNFPVVPFLVPTLMILVYTVMVQSYGDLTIPVTVGGDDAGYRPLCKASPGGMPLSSTFPDLAPFVQRGSHSPDVRPGSLFLKGIGSSSLGLWAQYSPISRGSQSPMLPRVKYPIPPFQSWRSVC